MYHQEVAHVLASRASTSRKLERQDLQDAFRKRRPSANIHTVQASSSDDLY